MLFILYRNGQPSVRRYFTETTATGVILTIILALNPLGAAMGVLFAFAFVALDQEFSQFSNFANNGIYLGLVLALALGMFLQTLLFSKSLWKYYLALAMSFASIFGGLIPLLSTSC